MSENQLTILDGAEVIDWSVPIARFDAHIWENITEPPLEYDNEYIWRIWCEQGYVSLMISPYNRIVGLLCSLATTNPHVEFLHKIMVSEDFRNKGIAGQLLDRYIQRAEAQHKDIHTAITPNDASMLRLLTSQDFHKQAYVEKYFRSGEPRLVFTRKAINQPPASANKSVSTDEEAPAPPIRDPFHPLHSGNDNEDLISRLSRR